jgi:hypothetical protein
MSRNIIVLLNCTEEIHSELYYDVFQINYKYFLQAVFYSHSYRQKCNSREST